MNEQIMHFLSKAAFQRVFSPPEESPVPFYIAHTPPKWNGAIECVTVCRAEPEDLASLDAVALGNYTDGLLPGAQEIIDRCYDRTPVLIPDTDPPEYYTPPEKIGEFA